MKEFAATSEQVPTLQELIYEKSRLVTEILGDRHTQQPRYDRAHPYEVFNETVSTRVETPKFTGIAMHNVHYDSGVNPEADTGPSETLVVAGAHGDSIVNFGFSSMRGLEIVAGTEQDAITALEETLGTLTSPAAN